MKTGLKRRVVFERKGRIKELQLPPGDRLRVPLLAVPSRNRFAPPPARVVAKSRTWLVDTDSSGGSEGGTGDERVETESMGARELLAQRGPSCTQVTSQAAYVSQVERQRRVVDGPRR